MLWRVLLLLKSFLSGFYEDMMEKLYAIDVFVCSKMRCASKS